MTNKEFQGVVKEQLQLCTDTLLAKGAEYDNSKDRLFNFRTCALLQGITMKQALGGQMAKHTVSINTMLQAPERYSVEKWNEKITDHINYLLLLKAIVVEETYHEDIS